MLPLSHTFIATKVTGRKNKLLVFGSVLPDVASTSGGKIDRGKIHNSPKKFLTFVENNYPELKELAVGVRLHSSTDKGADYYSDNYDTGFAVLQGRKIDTKVARLMGVREGKESIILAHNFIEAGVDLNLSSSHPNILTTYKSSIESVNLHKIADCLAHYLSSNIDMVEKELKKFIYFYNPIHLASFESMVKDIVVPLIKEKFGIEVDPQETVKLLNKAKKITKSDYLKYLDTAIKNMKRDFSNII